MEYFISYFISRDKNNNSGFGNTVIKIEEKIKGMEELDHIKKHIEDDRGFKDVIILHYQEMPLN